ncbi:uracil phosphoribosyltransferase [Blastocladiella britannica]|nr:uracil phosphoribosyltransferase [Blastocladiella britannica]
MSTSGRTLVSRHPLVAHKIRLLRDTATHSRDFRALIAEISSLLGYEATSHLSLVEDAKQRTTPTGAVYHGVKVAPTVALVPILRAGISMVDTFLDLLPTARVLHIGIFREKSTLQPVEYYNKLPSTVNVDRAIVLDPMIATAGTINATINILKDWGLAGDRITVVTVVASSEGLESLQKTHPDVTVHVAAVDDILNDAGYVVPGVGDAGDRVFNTIHD